MQDRPLRLLFVEDDLDYQAVLRKEMQRLGQHVEVETCFLDSVQSAQRAVDRADVDVVVSDFELPDGTGADVLAHAKAIMPHTQRIVLTGCPERARAATAHAGTTHDVWDKSAGLHELRSRLFRLVTQRAPKPSV